MINEKDEAETRKEDTQVEKSETIIIE